LPHHHTLYIHTKKSKRKNKKKRVTKYNVFQVSQFGLIIHSNGDLLGTENIQKIIALRESFHVRSCFRTVFAWKGFREAVM